MRIDDSRDQSEILPGRIRLLAIVTGCCTGIAGFIPFGPFVSLIALLLVVGATLQPYSPRSGRWLLWLGAFFVTMFVGVFLAPQAVWVSRIFRLHHEIAILTFLFFFIASIPLVIWCDVALAAEALRRTHAKAENHKPSRIAGVLVWVVAAFLTLLLLPDYIRGVLSYSHSGRLDILLLSLLFGSAILLFDLMLVINAFRARPVPRQKI